MQEKEENLAIFTVILMATFGTKNIQVQVHSAVENKKRSCNIVERQLIGAVTPLSESNQVLELGSGFDSYSILLVRAWDFT